MKTIRKIFVAAVAVLSTTFAFASGGLKVDMGTTENKVTPVEISSVRFSQFEIALTDEFGKSIYLDKTKAPVNKYKKNYNFENLEDGVYWFSVKVDNESTLNKLNVKDGKVTILEERKSVTPHFNEVDRMLKISFLNPQKENVKLFVYDRAKTLLAEASLGNEFAIHRAVDLSKLKFGDYEVVISNDMDIYEYQLTVE
jgi:hypothetical protein